MIKITFSKHKDKIVPQVTSDFNQKVVCMDKNLGGRNLFVSNSIGFMTHYTMFIGYREAEAEPPEDTPPRCVVESWIKLLLKYSPYYCIRDNAITFNMSETFVSGLPDWKD